MTWASEAAKHVNTPVVLVSIAFNSGTRYYSNRYVETATQGYKGNILNLPEISNSVGDIVRTFERGNVRLIFNDTDYEFRGLEITETVSFKNRTVTIKVGFVEDSYANLLTLYTGYIFDWRRLDNLKYEFDVEQKNYNLETEYPNVKASRDDYANIDASAEGQYIPIPYGTIDGGDARGQYGHPALTGYEKQGTGLLMVKITSTQNWLVGLQESGQVITVNDFLIEGTAGTEGVDWSQSNATVNGFEHTIIDGIGIVGIDTGWDLSRNLVSADITFGTRRPVAGIRHFLETFAGYAYPSDFNTAKYTTATTIEGNRGYTFDGVLWKPKPLRTILSEWRSEFELDIYWDRDGKLCFDYLSAAYSTPNKYNGVRDILANFDSDPQVPNIINKLKYGYDFNYNKAYFYNLPTKEDTDSQTKYGETYEAPFQGFYWIRSAGMALDIASRKIMRFRNPIVLDTYPFPLKSFSEDLTDVIKVTHFEGEGSSGYDNKRFQIRKMNLNLDNYVNSMLLEDCESFMAHRFVLGDDTVLPADWDNATTEQQEYGYLCDGTDDLFSNNIDPGKRLLD